MNKNKLGLLIILVIIVSSFIISSNSEAVLTSNEADTNPGEATNMITSSPKFPWSLFGVNLSYGAYQGIVTNSSLSGSSTSTFSTSQPNLGIGVSVKLPFLGEPLGMPNYFYDLGYHYNFDADGLTISYFHIDAMGINDNFYGGIGINYSFWNKDINGGLGFQFSAGKPISEQIMIGIKYILMSGKYSTNGYDNSYNISQLAFECKRSF